MQKTKLRDTDFLYLSTMLRAREAKMLSGDKIGRMLDAAGFDDAAKMAEECGYRDMSGLDVFEVDKRCRRTAPTCSGNWRPMVTHAPWSTSSG